MSKNTYFRAQYISSRYFVKLFFRYPSRLLPLIRPRHVVWRANLPVSRTPNKVEFPASIRYSASAVKLNEKYMTDRDGRPTDILLTRKDYRQLLDYLEDRPEIRNRKRNAKFVAWETAAV